MNTYKQLRTDLQVTQQELADLTGMTVGTISRLERGVRGQHKPNTLYISYLLALRYMQTIGAFDAYRFVNRISAKVVKHG